MQQTRSCKSESCDLNCSAISQRKKGKEKDGKRWIYCPLDEIMHKLL